MVRIFLFLAVLAAAAFGFSWLADRSETVALVLHGNQYEISLLKAVGVLIFFTIAVMIIWSILRFVFRIPTLMSLTARARRTNKGYAAVSKGMVAAAIGDAKATEKAAREAAKHLGDVPLTSLLQAQSAQIAGDRDKAIKTFNQMLENPETRVLGLRGLHLEAKRNGDTAAANVFAKEAYSLAALPWAGQALLEHHAMADDWSGALSVVESSIARKAIDKATGNRQRGVLKTGIAMSIADREPDEALRIAREAIKLAPDLIPAYVAAGRLLARRGDIRRGGRILEDGWRVSPHPDIARAYLDLRPGDSAADRLARARTLTKVYSDHVEARLVLARAALEARDFALARKTMEPLASKDAPRMTVRACLLMADLEETEFGESGRMREWLGRATRAARDPMWIADGIATDTWAPASPVTGKLDAFVWDTPVERLSAPLKPEPELPVEVLAPAVIAAAKPNTSADSAGSSGGSKGDGKNEGKNEGKADAPATGDTAGKDKKDPSKDSDGNAGKNADSSGGKVIDVKPVTGSSKPEAPAAAQPKDGAKAAGTSTAASEAAPTGKGDGKDAGKGKGSGNDGAAKPDSAKSANGSADAAKAYAAEDATAAKAADSVPGSAPAKAAAAAGASADRPADTPANRPAAKIPAIPPDDPGPRNRGKDS